MTTVSGSGFPLSAWFFFQGGFSVSSSSSTGFTTTIGATVTGTDLTYSTAQLSDGRTVVAITGGTITGLAMGGAGAIGTQTYSNLNISGVAFSAAIANSDQAGFNNLLFGGDDTFTWSSRPPTVIAGLGGNDVFNISNWSNAAGPVAIDGGNGSDTVNLSGGIPNYFALSYFDLISTGNYAQNFSIANVEMVNLDPGQDHVDYVMFVNTSAVAAGNTLTVDGSRLGPFSTLVFDTNVSGSAIAGNLVLIGGAGPDYFQGGTGNNIFNGGDGSDTVSFVWGENMPGRNAGVTVDLNITTSQSFGPGAGTGTLTSGHFVVNGVDQPAGTVIQIIAAQLSQTSFVTGTVGDSLQIRAMDSRGGWSAGDAAPWSPFDISLRSNIAPVVATADVNTTANQNLALSSLFSVSDADGDAMTKYELWDSTHDPNSGHFVVNGVAQSASTIIDVTAAQLSQTSFLTGTAGDILQIRAFDGYDWSAGDTAAWAPFHVNVS